MTSIGWGDWDRTSACGFQRPVPYRLATPQQQVVFYSFHRIRQEKNCLLVSDASSCPKEAEPIRQTFFSQEVSELNHEIGVKRFRFVMGDHEHGFSFRNRLFEIGEDDLFAFRVQM